MLFSVVSVPCKYWAMSDVVMLDGDRRIMTSDLECKVSKFIRVSLLGDERLVGTRGEITNEVMQEFVASASMLQIVLRGRITDGA